MPAPRSASTAPPGDVDRARLGEHLDQRQLLGRRTADQPAIVVQRRGQRPRQTGFARLEPCRTALNHQRGGDGPGSYGRPRRPCCGAAVEVTRTQGENVQDGRAINEVAAREQDGCVGGPDSAPPVARQAASPTWSPNARPLAGEALRELGAALARSLLRKGPAGEALQVSVALEVAGRPTVGEIEILRPGLRCRRGGSCRAAAGPRPPPCRPRRSDPSAPPAIAARHAHPATQPRLSAGHAPRRSDAAGN